MNNENEEDTKNHGENWNNWKNMKKKPKDLDAFLNIWKCKNKERPTHARIPCHSMNIKGGAFNIPNEVLSIFNKLYNKKVFRDKVKEYLVETQEKKKWRSYIDRF